MSTPNFRPCRITCYSNHNSSNYYLKFLFVIGTSHWNGITKEDVAELKDKGAKVIVLSRGQLTFLHVPPAIVEELQGAGFQVIVERSGLAMQTYNGLVEKGELVAGLFHTTC